ncbi:unnamed protein product [Rhodiola kirilowii]
MSAEQVRRSQLGQAANGNSDSEATDYSPHRLLLSPNENHRPQSYEGLAQDFSKMEKHLPPNMLVASRDTKFSYMNDIVNRYLPSRELKRISELKSYREKILSNYQPLHSELYTMAIERYITPRFMKAVNENTEAGYRSIMAQPSPGVFTFEIFQPQFCELLLSEVENIKRWVHDTKFRIMQPNTMVKCGVSLTDFGLGSMLDRLMTYVQYPNYFFLMLEGAHWIQIMVLLQNTDLILMTMMVSSLHACQLLHRDSRSVCLLSSLASLLACLPARPLGVSLSSHANYYTDTFPVEWSTSPPSDLAKTTE